MGNLNQQCGSARPNIQTNITHSMIPAPAALAKNTAFTWSKSINVFFSPLLFPKNGMPIVFLSSRRWHRSAARAVPKPCKPPSAGWHRTSSDSLCHQWEAGQQESRVCEWIWGVAHSRQVGWRSDAVTQDGPDDSCLLLLTQTAVISHLW